MFAISPGRVSQIALRPAAPKIAAGPVDVDYLFAPTETSADEVIAVIERLAELRDRGVLTEEEFAAKKVELLGRL